MSSLYTKIAQVSKLVGTLSPDGKNPAIGSKYLTLPKLLRALASPLKIYNLGIVTTHTVLGNLPSTTASIDITYDRPQRDGSIHRVITLNQPTSVVRTMVIDLDTNETLHSDFIVTPDLMARLAPHQAVGSNSSYGQRHNLIKLFSLPIDDDEDGYYESDRNQPDYDDYPSYSRKAVSPPSVYSRTAKGQISPEEFKARFRSNDETPKKITTPVPVEPSSTLTQSEVPPLPVGTIGDVISAEIPF